MKSALGERKHTHDGADDQKHHEDHERLRHVDSTRAALCCLVESVQQLVAAAGEGGVFSPQTGAMQSEEGYVLPLPYGHHAMCWSAPRWMMFDPNRIDAKVKNKKIKKYIYILSPKMSDKDRGEPMYMHVVDTPAPPLVVRNVLSRFRGNLNSVGLDYGPKI